MAYNRSVSQYKSWTRCGEAYRIQKFVKDKPERPAAWTAVGNAFHEAYEAWEAAGRRGSALSERFEGMYAFEIEKQKNLQPDMSLWVKTPRVKTAENDIKLRGEAGVVMAVNYEKHCREDRWEIAKLPVTEAWILEMKFEHSIGGVLIKGAVDVGLLWEDGQITLRDLKTGNKGKPDNRQLGWYRLILNEKCGLDIQYGEYWFCKLAASGGWVDLSRYTNEYVSDQVSKLDKAIDAGIFLANPGANCDFCDVRSYCREMGDG